MRTQGVPVRRPEPAKNQPSFYCSLDWRSPAANTGNAPGDGRTRTDRRRRSGCAAELTDSGQGGRPSGRLRAQDGGDVVTRTGRRAETGNDRCGGSRYRKRGRKGDARPAAKDTARVRSTRVGHAVAGMTGLGAVSIMRRHGRRHDSAGRAQLNAQTARTGDRHEPFRDQAAHQECARHQQREASSGPQVEGCRHWLQSSRGSRCPIWVEQPKLLSASPDFQRSGTARSRAR